MALRYMQGTKEFGVLYLKNKYFKLVGDSNTYFLVEIDNFAFWLPNKFGFSSNVLELQKAGYSFQLFSRRKVHINLGSIMSNCMTM